MTSAPAKTNCLAVSKPMPVFPPVTIATFPVMLGILSLENLAGLFVYTEVYPPDASEMRAGRTTKRRTGNAATK